MLAQRAELNLGKGDYDLTTTGGETFTEATLVQEPCCSKPSVDNTGSAAVYGPCRFSMWKLKGNPPRCPHRETELPPQL